MWNRNSRRWLVKDKSNMKRTKININWNYHTISRIIAATQQHISSVLKRQMCYKSCSITKMKYPPRQSRTSSNSNIGKQVYQSSSSPCLNQKLEVLLVILLANCLICTAAFEMATSLSSNINSRNLLHRRSNLIITEPENFSNDVEDFQTSSDTLYLHRSQNFKISPKPCSIGRVEGTCMFVWECIKSEGRHVGMCVDSFMFGSCCAHNYTDNIVLPQTFSYTRPTKPVGISSFNHRPRPPHAPHKPSISGMTTIERPHGAGTLVIRPSGPHHQGALHKPSRSPTTTSVKPTTTSSENPNPPWSSNAIASNDLQAAESISSSSVSPSNMWPSPVHTVVHQHAQHHWQMTTEPNFITKPRPPSWEKPTALRPKPSKPTKKPTATASPAHHHHQQHQQQQQQHTTLLQIPPSSSIVYSTRKPKPTPSSLQISTPSKHKPQQSPQIPSNEKPTTLDTTSNQYLKPTTQSWMSSSSHGTTILQNSTTTHKYRPSTSAPTTSHWTTASSSTYQPSTPSSLSPSKLSTQSLDHITIESNEIFDLQTDSKDGIPTVKTISAARGECGVPSLARPETRIVGGKSAPFGRWPWQVSVRRTSFFGFSSTHRCGGALINENWIATAGHCVDDLLTSQIRIRVGEYDFSHVQEQLPYIERGVVAKVVHPKYNFFTYEYDLALVKLEQSLEFAPHVSPICLPQTESLLIGMNATVTGWGRLSEGGTLPSVLQEVSVPIVSNDNCKSMFLRAGRQEFIPDIFLCAGYETGGQDSCQGDSGGPLQVKSKDGRYFLAGIISWGIGCAEANLPGVCTRISKFVPWILEHVT